MKRLVLTTAGTVAGLAALLSFKTQTHPLANAGPLPSAGTTTGGGTTTGTTTGTATGTAGSAGAGTATAGGTTTTGGTTTSPKSGATPSPATSPATAKTVMGQAITTRYGIVQVKVTVSGGRITDVAFVQLQAFDGRSQMINSYAAPQLLQETISAQSAQVDTISGASYTSDGYRQSLQSALDRAGFK